MGNKFVIRCDMEGATGIVSYEQAEPGKSEYAEGRRLFMGDLTALITGLHDGGAEDIIVYDEHFYGRNVILDEIPPYVKVICGKPDYTEACAGGLKEDTTGLILLGFHSKSGTGNALLQHSYEPDIADIRINGISVGETGIETAVAGSFGVPLVLFVGDSEGAREAKELSPDTVCVVVKESLSETGALCYSSAETSQKIYSAACKIAASTPEITPWNLGNVSLEVILRDTPFGQKYREVYGNAPILAQNANLCWIEYLHRKRKVLSL